MVRIRLAETYYVLATNATTNCKQLMNGIVVPTVNIVDGGEIGIDQAVCENSTPAAFTSTVAGTAGGALTYQWQSSPNNSAPGRLFPVQLRQFMHQDLFL